MTNKIKHCNQMKIIQIRINIILLLYISAVGAYTQSITSWENYTPYDREFCLLDIDTAVLAGSFNGVACINKATNQVTYFNSSNAGLMSGYVIGMARDNSGQLWIGSPCSLTLFTGGNWINYTPQNSILPASGISAMHYAPGANAILLGCIDGNVIKIDSSGWAFVLGPNGSHPMDMVRSLAVDSAGSIWAGTWTLGIYRYNGSDWQVYNNTNGLQSNYILSIGVDHNGLLWLSNIMRLYRFDGTSWQYYTCPYPIKYISADTSNTLWLSTMNGLYTFNGTFTYHPCNPFLTSTNLTCHLWDKSFAYTGTYSSGVDRINLNTLNVINFPLKPDLPGSNVHAIAFEGTGSKTWFAMPSNALSGYFGAVSSYDGIYWQHYNGGNSSLLANEISSLEVAGNNFLYVGTNDTGLYCLQGVNWIHYNAANSNIQSNQVSALSKGVVNDMLIGYKDGSIQSLQNNTFSTIIPGSLVNSSINKIKDDSNSVFWAATQSSGLLRYNYINPHLYHTLNSGIPSNTIRDIKIDAGHNYWIATDAGLVKFNGIATWTVYNTGNSGLPENNVTAVAIGSDSSVWAGTEHLGLARFDGTSWTTYDGCNSPLLSNHIQVMENSPDGRIYIGTNSGVSIVSIDNITGRPVFAKPSLVNAYPNPGSGIIRFELHQHLNSSSLFTISNAVGQAVFERKLGRSFQNQTSILWDTKIFNIPPGLYFYTLLTGTQRESGKVMVIK